MIIMIMTVTLTLAIRVIMIMIMIMVMKMKLFFKVIQYLLTHGEMDPNVKDEILQVFSLSIFSRLLSPETILSNACHARSSV